MESVRLRSEDEQSGMGFCYHARTFFVDFLLSPEDAAPVLVLRDGHAAFDAHAHTLHGLGLLGKQLLENGHDALLDMSQTEKPPRRFARICVSAANDGRLG